MDFNYFQSFIGAVYDEEYLFPTLRIARIASGKGEWQIGENIYPCSTGSIILLNNLTPRKMINVYHAPIIIDIFEFPPFIIQDRPLLISAFYGGAFNTFNKNTELINELLNTISKAYSKIESKDFYRYQLQAVFSLIEEGCSASHTGINKSSLAFEAAKFIWEHFSENLCVLDIAKHFNVSKNHLEIVFKQVHGICVGKYIRHIRIYNVLSLLKSKSEISVLEAALTCGFNSSSGFYKAFKSITGKRPRRN